MMRSIRCTIGAACSTLVASSLYSPAKPLTVNEIAAGATGMCVSGRSVGDTKGTCETPGFAEDSAIECIFGVAALSPTKLECEGCGGGEVGGGGGGAGLGKVQSTGSTCGGIGGAARGGGNG